MAKFEDQTTVLDVRRLASSSTAPAESTRSAVFVVLTGSQAGRMYKLDAEQFCIGRGSDATIRIEDEGVSRRHALIVRGEGGKVTVQDLGSTNGTFCNGTKVDSRVLTDGDKIQIGTTTILKFSYQDTVEEEFQRRQYESATRDPLTSCYNKKYFLERLPSEFAFAQRHGKALALAMIDIDHFKKVNDTFGHQAGDYVLSAVARTIHEHIRADDVLARYGGEEFALIMRETPLEAAFIAVERIRRKVESTQFSFDGKRVPVTISAGVALLHGREPSTPEDLISIADKYLYKAKGNGRNRTESEVMG